MRRARGRLLGGDTGRALVDSAVRDLSARGIRRPDRFAAMVAPGEE
jgi:hypothetical protein